jgi:deoxyribonuclease IV
MFANRDELGAHVSAAGGVSNAPARAAALDAVVLQLFTKMASRWAEPLLDDDEVAAFRAGVAHHGIHTTAAHDSYLINLASPDAALRARSSDSFLRELQRCVRLGIDFVVTHPGNATDGNFASAIARNADAVTETLAQCSGVSVLFETTAGAGRVLGATFEQLADIICRIPDSLQPRIGICVDTCHVWAAGYDIRTAYDEVFARLDDAVGLERVRLFHLNDSVGGLGSRRDRHAHIGQGALGDVTFRRLLQDDRFARIPKLLETPKDDDVLAADRRNLARLRGYRIARRGRNKSPMSRKK